ncbi:MAG: Rid family detoxifying hydrolase [Rhizobium sp.]
MTKTPIAYPGMNAEDRPMGPAPLSAALLCEPMLFISGQVAIDPYTKEVVGDDVAAQTAQILKNMEGLLQSAGMDLSNIVKVNIFMTDLSKFGEMNDVYAKAFAAPYPARATVGITLNDPKLLLELDAVAMR